MTTQYLEQTFSQWLRTQSQQFQDIYRDYAPQFQNRELEDLAIEADGDATELATLISDQCQDSSRYRTY